MVDLDGAKAGAPRNLEAVRRIAAAVECETDGNMPVRPGQVLEKLEAVARHAALA